MAVIDGWYWVPYSWFDGPQDIANETARLFYKPRGAVGEPKPDPVPLYRKDNARQLLAVPRAYGVERFGLENIIDRRSEGHALTSVTRLPDPNHPRVRDKVEQARFMEALEASARADHHYLAAAGTGTGKTVSSLRTSARIGRTTVVCVHLERLAKQWLEEIEEKLGVDRSRIGFVQGERCEFMGKDYVVAMMPTLSQRIFPQAFYDYFGTCIYDEVHRVGTPLLSQCAPLFSAKYRWGFSATLDRADDGAKVYYWHIGPLRVISDQAPAPIDIYVKRYTTNGKLFGKTHGSRMMCLSRDPRRNEVLVELIMRLYKAGRHSLVVGESVRHVQHLMRKCIERGMDPADAGQFTGERHDAIPVLRNGKVTYQWKKVKNKAEYLDHVKANCRMVFATYGMITEGIDIPRLEAGIDVTPRGSATQLIGRVRRPVPGKPKALWITMVDTRCGLSNGYFKRRCRDYLSTGAHIVEGKL